MRISRLILAGLVTAALPAVLAAEDGPPTPAVPSIYQWQVENAAKLRKR